ncbi:protein RRP6-like 2 isoform X2 [Brachypodium distachyon]|uniref:HRDC domain-containing protein n=1 Tax=Brachypodium distachyon TaxID=15368 RepID=I1H9J3_BRADI|nr:protein RRP6-like 2 isoform X2 [Brachypodium distachyon]KQK23562.1 hypothetical protein BRADI_1g74597v3 [Brachypodium distachyon]|eukprot:XP_024318471.1 protein RRP6-like 2 isoform X2 [Brachypodium distachyon]
MDGSKGAGEREAEEEEAGDGSQVAHGEKRKNKRPSGQDGGGGASGSAAAAIPGAASSARTATSGDRPLGVAPAGAKARVAYHDPSIPRPQDVYLIRVNNCNLPFDHVWLEPSEDGTRRIHPLEKLPLEQLIDRNVPEIEPVRPADVEDSPFTLVEDLKGLMELVDKLKDVNEFAVDLEHNQYRSFQGLTCLMQISTRTEDFIVDTLKLRIYLGPYLQKHFKDPTKRKVMHGADRDIIWLQRDFRIYVCNLFDTGQASRVLQMERNSLEHLLHHFCGVTANKVYQNADWRSRPLSDEMIKYAREDTHYLLYIYDLMRLRLQKESTCENDLLLEVQNRSNEICLQLYEKELLTDTSYLHIYGLQEHELEAAQLAVVSALHQWRDYTARQEDESTGYVLPNKALIEIAKKMPTSTAELQRIVKSKYPFVEANFDVILDIVWNATENSEAFEAIAEQLKKARLGELDLKSILASGEVIEMVPSDADNVGMNPDPADQYSAAPSTSNISLTSNRDSFMSETASNSAIRLYDNTQTISSSDNKTSWTLAGLSRPINKEVDTQPTVQELKSPASFGDQASGFYYPQIPEYSSVIGWSHPEPEVLEAPGYLSGCYYGFPSINQSTGTGHPSASNREGDSQDPTRQHHFPPAGN